MNRAYLLLPCLLLLAALLIGCGGPLYPVPPSITSQPAPVISNCGLTANFYVAATGTAPLYYQWKWNGFDLIEGGGGGRVSGVTTSHLRLTNLQSGDTGGISVVVSNSIGWTASPPVNLVVRDTLSFSISWPYGDLDIGVWEPDYDIFYVSDGYSDNGYFSADHTNGGMEYWVLNSSHQAGTYNLLIAAVSYTGNVTISATHNGEDEVYRVEYVEAGNEYTYDNIEVVRDGGKTVLKYNVTVKPITGAVKREPAAPRAFGS